VLVKMDLTERHICLDVGFVTLGDEARLTEVTTTFGVLAAKQVTFALLTTKNSTGAGNLKTFRHSLPSFRLRAARFSFGS
jgi:hypothetical protein